MKKLGLLSLFLVLLPIFSFIGLLFLAPPVGNPQDSESLVVKLLDYQITYFMREKMPFPPPLPAIGLAISLFLWKRHNIETARIAAHVGLLLLGFWLMISIVPLMIHIG